MASRLPAAPPVLAGFSYIRPLGTGGFADVFLFEQDLPRRPVAVKVMLQDVVDDGLLRMFNAEADVMARLSAHPSILTIYQASVSADGRPYIVMEYCPRSLSTRYRREVIPVPEVLSVGIRISSALETAHRSGLLHRDIKPSNILVTAFGSPVLSDFGIAASLTARADGEVFALSVPWSAPEVIDEQVPGSIASEVWSLGATIYSLLAGRSPFEDTDKQRNTRELLKSRIRRARYVPVARADVPPSLEAVLRRALAKDPADRHVTVAELARELQLVQRELGLLHTPLEVAVDEWALSATPIDFHDDRLRGPARPTVDRVSARRTRTRSPRALTAESPDDAVLSDAQNTPAGLRPRTIALICIGAAIAAGALTAAILVALQGL